LAKKSKTKLFPKIPFPGGQKNHIALKEKKSFNVRVRKNNLSDAALDLESHPPPGGSSRKRRKGEAG